VDFLFSQPALEFSAPPSTAWPIRTSTYSSRSTPTASQPIAVGGDHPLVDAPGGFDLVDPEEDGQPLS
jgi:hypothetical protein